MPTLKELAKQDPMLRSVVIIGSLFVILPPIISYFDDPYGWKPEFWKMMVFGFGGPYLVLAFLLVGRWRKLTRLSERGQRVLAVVEKTWSNREGKGATVRFTHSRRKLNDCVFCGTRPTSSQRSEPSGGSMKSAVRLALVAAFLFAIALPVVAQNEPAEFIQIITTTVRPNAVTEYEDYVKKVMAGASKIGAPQRVLAYQVAAGGPSFTYNFVIPFNKWEEMDGWPTIPQILTRAYGDGEGAKILQSGRDVIEHSESAVFRILRNLSTRPKVNDPPAAFVLIVRTEVEPGTSVSYERFLSKLKAAQEQEQGTRTVNRSVSVLGPALTYLGANFFNKHADRDSWAQVPDLLRKTYGEADGQELFEGSLRAVRKREVFIQSYRPDLSRPAPKPRP